MLHFQNILSLFECDVQSKYLKGKKYVTKLEKVTIAKQIYKWDLSKIMPALFEQK